MNEFDEASATDDAPRRRFSVFNLAALLALAWLVYEATAQPALGAVLACLKFGWDDWRTSIWLWRTDPNRGRARACLWAYFAAGLWRAAIVGTIFMFALGFFIDRKARGANG